MLLDRYYDTAMGRFISEDPIGFWGGYNLYLYAPNPFAWIDPWGWAAEFPSDNHIGELFNTTRDDFHKNLKKRILKDHQKELNKNLHGARNPDIGHGNGNVAFRDRITGKTYPSVTPIDTYRASGKADSRRARKRKGESTKGSRCDQW